MTTIEQIAEERRRIYSLPIVLADHTGATAHALTQIPRYREAFLRQHRLVFEAWRLKDYERALVELHLALIALDRVGALMRLVAKTAGEPVASYVSGLNYGSYNDARNHFEHLEDRVYGTRKNAPVAISENGASRTVHVGLNPSDQTFNFSDRKIDISQRLVDRFFADIDGFCQKANEIVEAPS